ncbi:patatin-like phospholipase family protein [Natronospirillum operosum]|uniref:Patatin-like phospholipase family protein n=1 Tax=Natronospirillum operosum TaxID=2759953 RepID=A0A4Z0W4U2_9GAMM|nr:patatin-like phospholipase family protein [Natronospirillum operosum]TGG90405.1 patatin-like phospholipase family protein [Natronospirillum operosum]
MHALQILAGTRALERIREHQFKPDDIRLILGASGGPRWFVLSHLDQLIARELLPQIKRPVHLAGSSIGAWRMACYAAPDPVAALKRLEDHYLHQSFPKGMTPQAVTDQCADMLSEVLGPDYRPQINRLLHIITARCKGRTMEEDHWQQFYAFALVASGNALSRRTLRWHFDRHLVQSQPGSLPVKGFADFRTTASQLNHDNLFPALMASAAIPMAMAGIASIPGSSPGPYRDGGMVDYHFDLPFETPDGVILYPHFQPQLKPGWFDKQLRWRRVKARNYKDVVLLTPSPAFIEKLPYGKVPDRRDFHKMTDADRITYWKRSVQAGERLAEEFNEWVSGGGSASMVKPLIPSKL